MLKKLAISGTGLALVLGGVVGAKTIGFASNLPEVAASKTSVPAFDPAVAAGHLGEAIRFQTVSHQNPAENKPEEWTKLQGWIQSTYPAFHAAAQRSVIAGGTLVYEWKGSDPAAEPIILMAHQDVVPVTPGTEKEWVQQPFSGAIAEGKVWGRGALDDKGSLIGLLEAADLMAKQGFKPKRTIWIVSGHDEEVGGSGAKAAAALITARGQKALFTLDEGALIITDAPGINAPAILIGVAEKGYATIKVTAKALGGHSSMPPEEIGTVNLAKAILAIHGKQFAQQLRPPVSDMVDALAVRSGGTMKMAAANPWLFGGMIMKQVGSSPSGAAMLHTTIAPTMLEGSPKENVLPQSANALINYRIAPWNSSKEVMERAKEAVGRLPVTLEWVKPPREPSPVSSMSSEGWKLIGAAALAESPGAPIVPNLVVGGTDSRNFVGTSRDVYRFMPVKLSTTEAKMFHGTNEHMSIENMERLVRFYARLIATAAG